MLKQEAFKTIKLSLPIILGELTQMSLGIINSAMVGSLHYKQLAASALVNNVMNIPYVFGIGMSMCISQTVATANGQKDNAKVSHYLYNGVILMVVTSVVISVLLEAIRPILFHLGQDQEVATLSGPYLRLMGFSVIPMLLFFALKQFTDGLELTKTAAVLSIASMPLNVLLDYTFIFGHFGFPRMELRGAGIGTLVTRTLILVILALVIVFHPRFKQYMAPRKAQWHLRKQTLKELLHIGIPSSLQGILEVAAFAVSGILAGTFGAVALAAHQIALQAAAFTFMASMGLAQGSAIRIGNAFGRGNWKNIQEIGKSTFIIGLIYGVFCATIFVFLRNYIPLIFNKDVNVVYISSLLLLFAAIFQIFDATQAIGVGALRGVKDVKAPTIYMSIAYWVLGIPIGALLSYRLHWGIYGIWSGFVIGLSVVSVLLYKRFNKLVNFIEKYAFGDVNVSLLIPQIDDLKIAFDNQKENTSPPYWGKIWSSALGLSQYISEHKELFLNKKVLEIGGGLGLPSFVAAYFAQKVICSDYVAEAVNLLKENIDRNERQNMTASLLDWRDLDPNMDIDIVLISDLNYEPELFDQLYQLLIQLLRDGKTILLATPQRLLAKSFVTRLHDLVVDNEEMHVAAQSNTSEDWVNVFLLKI